MSTTHADRIAEIMREVSPRLLTQMSTGRVPGLAVGVVNEQGLAWSSGLGAADLASGRRPDERTLFRVASITKTFTAATILQVRDEGRLSLDDPLHRHLPEFRQAIARAGGVDQVTIRRLLAHHSGLSTESPLPSWDAQEFPTREAMLDAISRTEIVLPPDSAFKYSNLAYGLLGEVVSRVSGRPFPEFLRERILEPLQMRSSTLHLNDEQQGRLAVGYHARRFDDGFDVAGVAPLNGIEACGQLHSTVEDLAKWIAFQFLADEWEEETSPPNSVLSAATIRESHRPQYLEPDWSVGYCLGWRANRIGERVYHGHGGALYGYASYVLFSRPHRLGVICLANVWPHPGLMGMAVEIAEAILAGVAAEPRTPAPWAAVNVPADLAPLLGIYEARPGIFAAVACRDGELRLEKTPLSDYLLHAPAALERATTCGEFQVRGGRAAGERLTFVFTPEGLADSFSLGGFVYRRLR